MWIREDVELPGAACTVKNTNPQMQNEGQKTGQTADKHQKQEARMKKRQEVHLTRTK